MNENGRTVHSALIAAEIERQIIDQHWPAGAKLDEVALARQFGVSRTPIREALHIVVSRSLARRVPYKGVLVADISRERVDQMFEAMSEIEATCGRLAAVRMTMTERGELESLHQSMSRMAERGDFKTYDAANTEFHRMIFRGTHNEDLVEIAEATRLKLAPFRSSQLQQVKRLALSNAEHETVVQAILDGSARDADRALRRHLQSAAKTVLAARS